VPRQGQIDLFTWTFEPQQNGFFVSPRFNAMFGEGTVPARFTHVCSYL
jgi:hypothetical protein